MSIAAVSCSDVRLEAGGLPPPGEAETLGIHSAGARRALKKTCADWAGPTDPIPITMHIALTL